MQIPRAFGRVKGYNNVRLQWPLLDIIYNLEEKIWALGPDVNCQCYRVPEKVESNFSKAATTLNLGAIFSP